MNRREALAALVSMPEIARISSAPVKPKDVIVVECAGRLSEYRKTYIGEQLSLVWPDNKIVVFEDGMSLKVVEGTQP